MKKERELAKKSLFCPDQKQMAGKRGFTIVELLVVVGIVVILTALAVPALSSARSSANRVKAVAQMRSIGFGILGYTSDQNGYLPGPLRAGQGASFNPVARDQLATLIGPYLGVTDFTQKMVVKAFLPPSYTLAMPAEDPLNARPYLMNLSAWQIGTQPGSPTPGPPAVPLKFVAVPPLNWALCDADQLNPMVRGQPWAGDTPTKIIHGSRRLALYLNGSVGPIAESDLAASDSGRPPGPPPSPH